MKYKLLLLLTCTLVACSNNEPAQPQATVPVADSAPLADTTPVADAPLADDPALTTLDPAEADAGAVVVNSGDESISPQTLGMLSTAPNLPTLVSSYRVNRKINGFEQAEYVGSVYRPRQVANGAAIEVDSYNSNGQKSTIADAKIYAGWDLLIPRNYLHTSLDTRPDWFSITLTRPAVLAVGLRSKNIPAWLNSWTKSASLAVTSNGKAEEVRVFKKTFAAGKVDLGGVSAQPGGENAYIVMLAEQNGAPSAVPSVPAGQEAPKPNSACPAWVHDQYMTTGPDGKQYRTWHPQIDPVYWCTFGHEHGSDPSLAGTAYKVAFGYTATLGGMVEPHNGFKINVFRNPSSGFWVVTHHFGTGGVGRACVSMHTVDMALIQNNVIKADLHYMGDFGKGMAVTGKTSQAISSCTTATVAAPAMASTGARMINLLDNKGYEPWRMDSRMLNVGATFSGLTFDTGDAITGCASVACTALVPRPGNFGADHRIMFGTSMVLKGSGKTQGTFYTDSMGMKIVDATTPGAVKQYIEPGLNLDTQIARTTCFTQDAWRGLMGCGGQVIGVVKNLERGLGSAN